MNVCLIGASGFVGTRLVELLITKYPLINIDKCKSEFYPKITQIADIRDNLSLKCLLKDQDIVVLLAAEHRDDVYPTSLYYDVNVQGARNVLHAMDENEVRHLIFTSSVAIYGLNKENPNERHPEDPFNHYGKSKWAAEEVLREWYQKDKKNRSLAIIRPTVIFGERNRGNVYNLLRQIASGKFLMIGSGKNRKSMAYVGNVVAFIEYCINTRLKGYELYNYTDKSDFTMNELVEVVGKVLNKNIPSVRIPYALGMLAGYGFDLLAKVTGRKLSISSVRVKKFCATTQYDATAAHSSGFVAPFSLEHGLSSTLEYEFVRAADQKDDITFQSE